jgi:hypothetical protein
VRSPNPCHHQNQARTALEDLQSKVADKNVCLTPTLVLQVNLGIDGCAIHFEL